MAKTKPETVAATDETTLPLEAQAEAPVVEGADIPQGEAPAADPVAPEAEGDAPEGEAPVVVGFDPAQSPDEQVTHVVEGDADGKLSFTPVDPVPEGANVHGIGPDVGGGPNPDYNPDADPLPTDDQVADPVALPDADLLTTLVASIERRNTGLHRPALLGELVVLGASIEGASIMLAGVRAEAVSEDEGLLLTNWCMAARQALAVIADV